MLVRIYLAPFLTRFIPGKADLVNTFCLVRHGANCQLFRQILFIGMTVDAPTRRLDAIVVHAPFSPPCRSSLVCLS